MKKRKVLSVALALILSLALVPPIPVQAGKESASTSIVAGIDVTFVIKADNSLWAWGNNGWGQLGDGTDKDKNTPVKIMDDVKSVYVDEGSTHSYYAMAIKTDSSLWAWGGFNYGQFGDGTTESKHSPVKITDGVSSVSFGNSYTLILKTDGSLWGTGENIQGQLGDGTGKSKYIPVKIMDRVASMSAGNNYAMAVKTDGSLWAWGANSYGGLGDGTKTDRLTPVKIMDGVASVSIGSNFPSYAMAVKKDGSLWAWGAGPVGDGTENNIETPTKIMDGVLSVTLGKNYAMAIKTDSGLWSWGLNSRGELGNGTKEKSLSPVKILDGVASVSLSGHGVQYTHVQAIKTDGSLWAWGSNDGKIGNGALLDRLSPVKIMDGVVATSAGSGHGVAVKADGSLWSWGGLWYNPSIELQQVKKVETTAKYYEKNYAHFSNNRIDKGFVLRYAWSEEYAELESYKEFYVQTKSITAGLTDDYAKAKAIYDWVCKNVTYDKSLEGKVNDNRALTVLHNKRAVCDGYTYLTEALLRASGIPARRISSAVSMKHAWNEAFVGGRWIIMDTTWGSGAQYAPNGSDYYFDISLEEMSSTHEYAKSTGTSKDAVIPMKIMDGVKQ